MKRLACVALALGPLLSCAHGPTKALWTPSDRQGAFLACRESPALDLSAEECLCVVRKLEKFSRAPADVDGLKVFVAVESCLPPPPPPARPWGSLT